MIAELFALILAVVAGILSAAIGYQFSRRIGLSEAHARVAVALLFSQVVTLFLALTAILDMPGDDAFLGGASFWPETGPAQKGIVAGHVEDRGQREKERDDLAEQQGDRDTGMRLRKADTAGKLISDRG